MIDKKNFVSSLLVACLLLLLAFLSISSLRIKSITLDEEKYIKAGKYVYEEFRWDNGLMILHPPLTFYIQGIASQIFSPTDDKQALYYARLMMQPLLLIFAFLVFLIAKKRYGLKSGLFALLLFTFNSEILAHGRLIGIDFSLALFIFLALISFYNFLEKPDWKMTIISSYCLGLALLTKYNALLLLPIFLLTFFYHQLFVLKKISLQTVGKFIVILGLSVFIVNLGYLFTGSLRLPERYDSSMFTSIANNRLGNKFLRIFPKAYVAGADYQYQLSKTGWIGFLMGETKWGGWWYFYATAFLFKTAIPFLILILLFLILAKKEFFEKYVLFSLLFFFAYLSFFNIINNGFRYVLMIFPLLILLVSRLADYRPKKGVKVYKWFLVFLTSWYVLELVLIYPHYLTYANQLIGGPKNAYKYFADSNLDFGQDWEVAQKYFSEHKEVIVNPEPPTVGRIAVSVNFLNLNHGQDFWLRRIKKKPTAYINYSWLIYDITDEDLQQLNLY